MIIGFNTNTGHNFIGSNIALDICVDVIAVGDVPTISELEEMFENPVVVTIYKSGTIRISGSGIILFADSHADVIELFNLNNISYSYSS